MSEAERNKLAAQIIKADMLGDQDKAARLKRQLEHLGKPPPKTPEAYSTHVPKASTAAASTEDPTGWLSTRHSGREPAYQKLVQPRQQQSMLDALNRGGQDNRVKKFLSSTGSLSQMFEQEKRVTASDEVKMFMKTSAKFSRDDMETKHFSEEIDNSEMILNKSKRRKTGATYGPSRPPDLATSDSGPCYKCVDRVPRHLVIDSTDDVYMTVTDSKPFLSHMSNTIISNKSHTCNSFVSADHRQQSDTETMIGALREMWKGKGYRCMIMETYFRDRRPAKGELSSCGNHFQVHCLPIKEKHFERSRMSFKQALQECEQEWSMNRKLISTDDRKIQRSLPRGLSYFWICFDELSNGFGHVIEQENNFSRFFGLEVLSGMLDKDFNPMRLNQREDYDDQFKRCRDFKLLYSEHKSSSTHQ